jgi:hypothetical protein
MAKQRFRGALNAANFPLVSTLQGRTVVQPQLDNNVKTNQAFYGTQESADYSIPQLLYCENSVPTVEGMQSVGYETVIPGLSGVTVFDQAITIRDTNENNFLFAPCGGLNYVYRANDGVWAQKDPITGAQGKSVTRAYVNGRTLICYETLGIYEYDPTADTFTKQTLVGLADADVRGIFSSNNYLGIYTDLVVHWSSLVDPLDFVPSLDTGAGFAIPQDVKAQISAVVGTAGGFIIYTAKNAVAAVYTQNIRAPFSFKEVSNAGGILSYEQVTSDQNSGPQYAWTTGGLQKITTQNSEPVSAEINDFLAGRMWEEWDAVNKKLITHKEGAAEFGVKVTYAASRYLMVSYSVDNSGLYQYAIVMDMALKRWGKLKIDHVDCFAYPYPNVFGDLMYSDLEATAYDALGKTSYTDLAIGVASDPPSKRAIGFLGSNGSVQLALMDYNKTLPQKGVAVFGKFQLVRARVVSMQQLELEGVYSDGSTPLADAQVTAVAALDGKNADLVTPMVLLKQTTGYQRWAKRVIGVNISIAVEGTFALSSYLLELAAEGDR